MATKAERRAARERVSAYHESQLAGLLGHVGAEIDRYRAGEIDAYAADETIHHCHRAAAELWKFCFARGGGAHVEFIAGLLDRMTAEAETIDWWERGAPIAAHPVPGQIDSSLTRTAGPIVTEQPLIVSVGGIDYDLGKVHTYLLSARIEGDITAEPGPNGTIDVTIVPGENNYAVRSLRKLTITEVQAFIDGRNSATSRPRG